MTIQDEFNETDALLESQEPSQITLDVTQDSNDANCDNVEDAYELEFRTKPVPSIQAEAFTICSYAWQIYAAFFLQTLLNSISIFSLGHVGTKELAAASLTTMFCNVTGFSLGIGLGTALDTLCSQSITASRDKHALGRHLQRGVVVMLILSIPVVEI